MPPDLITAHASNGYPTRAVFLRDVLAALKSGFKEATDIKSEATD